MTRAAPFGFSKVVFLSHVIDDSTPVFPGDPPVQIHPAATIEQDGGHPANVRGEMAACQPVNEQGNPVSLVPTRGSVFVQHHGIPIVQYELLPVCRG